MSHPSSTWTLVDSSTPAAGGTSTLTPGVDLQLDGDGDLVVDTDAHFTTGLEAVAQGIRIRLQMFRGEWFADLDAGMPYFQEILGQKFSALRVRAAFREAIEAAPGVVEILSLDILFDGASRNARVSWKVRGDAGVFTGSTEVG